MNERNRQVELAIKFTWNQIQAHIGAVDRSADDALYRLFFRSVIVSSKSPYTQQQLLFTHQEYNLLNCYKN